MNQLLKNVLSNRSQLVQLAYRIALRPNSFLISNPNAKSFISTSQRYLQTSQFKLNDEFKRDDRNARFQSEDLFDNINRFEAGKFRPQYFNKYKKRFTSDRESRFNKQPYRQTDKNYGSTVDDFEGAEPVETIEKEDFSSVKSDFSSYNLPQELLSRLNELGYTKPFKIQEATLEHTLAGK